MSKKLKTLDEHNTERVNHYYKNYDNSDPVNGIACPECSSELYDKDFTTALMSIPPKVKIFCRKCPYTGYRVL